MVGRDKSIVDISDLISAASERMGTSFTSSMEIDGLDGFEGLE